MLTSIQLVAASSPNILISPKLAPMIFAKNGSLRRSVDGTENDRIGAEWNRSFLCSEDWRDLIEDHKNKGGGTKVCPQVTPIDADDKEKN